MKTLKWLIAKWFGLTKHIVFIQREKQKIREHGFGSHDG